MKKYKLSEVIAALEENSKLRFQNESVIGTKIVDSNTFKATITSNTIGYIDGKLCWLKADGTKFNDFGISQKNNYLWTLVQDPVSFLEAAQAFDEGKTVECKLDGNISTYKPTEEKICLDYGYKLTSGVYSVAVTTREILEGVWTIKED